MKKVALSLMALAVVAAGAFADAPKWDPKVSTGLTGNASVTLGYDLDTGVANLSNGTSVSLFIDLVSGGDAVTKSDKDVWGEIRVFTDGDPVRIKADGVTSGNPTTYNNGFNLKVDYAKIHFGKDAYLSVLQPGTDIGYANSPDVAFLAAKRSGLYGATVTDVWGALASQGANGTAAGIELGYTLPSIASITVDLGDDTAWASAGPNRSKGNLNYKAAVDVSAVPNATIQAGYSSSTKDGATTAMGGKVGYKVMMGEKAFLKPLAGVTQFKVGTADAGLQYSAGVVYALDGKAATFDNFGLKVDNDYGGYPGVALGVIAKDKVAAGNADGSMWLGVSANSGALIEGATVVAAYEIADLKATKQDSVLTVGASTSLKSGDVTVAPAGTFNYESDANALSGAGATYMYLQAKADITGLFPFVTFTVNYQSNDFADKGNTVAGESKGKFELTTKVSF